MAELTCSSITRPFKVKASKPCKRATLSNLRSCKGKRGLKPTKSPKWRRVGSRLTYILAQPGAVGPFFPAAPSLPPLSDDFACFPTTQERKFRVGARRGALLAGRVAGFEVRFI